MWNISILPACVPLFSVIFGVRAVRKALLLSLMAEVEVTVFSKEACSILQSAG